MRAAASEHHHPGGAAVTFTIGESVDAESPSLTSQQPSPLLTPSTIRGASGVTCVAWLHLARCCDLWPSWMRSLLVSLAYTPILRQVWAAWLVVCVLGVLQWTSRDLTLVLLVLICGGCTILLSLIWAIASGGFHRGLGLLQLLFFIPLAMYLAMRLAGLDHDNFDNSGLKADSRLYAYANTMSVTLGVSCIVSFMDVLSWIRSHRRVYGHAAMRLAAGGSPRTVENSLSPRASVSFRPLDTAYGSTQDETGSYAILGRSLDSDSGSLGSALGSGSGPESIGMMSPSFEWTPRTRTEALLNRAASVVQAQQQQQERRRQQQMQRNQQQHRRQPSSLTQAAAPSHL